jgi:hypothetical protein
MFSTLDITYVTQRLENATRRAERAAQQRGSVACRKYARLVRCADDPRVTAAPACC